MKRLKTTVTYLVPCGPYCNHSLQKSTPLTRCRFCTEVSRGSFVCVLHNDQLGLEYGTLICKSSRCSNKEGPVEEQLPVSPQELMKHAIAEYHKAYIKLIASGVPEKLADKTAKEEALK